MRTAASGAHLGNWLSSRPSSIGNGEEISLNGFPRPASEFGWGQSDPHTIRSGLAATSACANPVTSGKSGGPLGDTVGARNLHIDTAGFDQIEQRNEIRLTRTLSRVAAAEMVDHHRERHLRKVILQPRDHGGAGVDLNMPAESADLLGGCVEDGFGIGWIEPSRGIGFEIEPHAANACPRHLFQSLARCGPVYDRNTARPRAHAGTASSVQALSAP